MAIFLPQTQKDTRNHKIAFATITGLCLSIIGIGSVQAVTSDNRKNASSETNNSSSSDPADAQANITIDGKKVQVGKDGRLHKTWRDGNSHGEIDIDINTRSKTSSDSSSSVRIETHTRSSSASGD